jgi:hypothetical protein
MHEDFRRYFGEEPPKAGGVAIMSDTDNTGSFASAWYGPISIKQDDCHHKTDRYALQEFGHSNIFHLVTMQVPKLVRVGSLLDGRVR